MLPGTRQILAHVLRIQILALVSIRNGTNCRIWNSWMLENAAPPLLSLFFFIFYDRLLRNFSHRDSYRVNENIEGTFQENPIQMYKILD